MTDHDAIAARGVMASASLLLCAPLANWMIGHVGECVPDGPCLVPVWPGIMAPSGVLVVGIALAMRDYVQDRAGWRVAYALIVGGAILSFALADPRIAAASAAAFLLSETLDMAVYTPLRRRGLAVAVLASGIAGAIADSALFVLLAFGSLDFSIGNAIGKLYASGAFAAWLWWRR